MLQNMFTPNANRETVDAASITRLAENGIGVFVAFSSFSTVHQKCASVAYPKIASTNETKWTTVKRKFAGRLKFFSTPQ